MPPKTRMTPEEVAADLLKRGIDVKNPAKKASKSKHKNAKPAAKPFIVKRNTDTAT